MKTKLVWTILRVVTAIVVLALCRALFIDAAKSGVSRLFSALAIAQSDVGPADMAVGLSPSDPEAHYTRGVMLSNADRLTEAVAELRLATRLRPHHYYEWLDLGVTLERQGDQDSSLAALRESIRLAPSFAQPRWQLGNFLFRQGVYQQAFDELRRAAHTDPNLFEQTLELGWLAANGDVATFEALTQPDTTKSRIALGRFLAVKEKWAEAAQVAAAAGDPEDDWDRTLLRQTITRLIAAQQFPEAFKVWSATHSSGRATQGGFLNGDFSEPIARDDPGFGWQLESEQNVSPAIDPVGPAPSARSLLLTFSGD